MKGGLNREGGLIKFLPLKGGGLFERGGVLNRGFTVLKIEGRSDHLWQCIIIIVIIVIVIVIITIIIIIIIIITVIITIIKTN